MVSRASNRTVRQHQRILRVLSEEIALAREPETLNLSSLKVSRWSIGEHLEHLVAVDRGVLERLSSPDDPPPQASTDGGMPSPAGWLVLSTGYIPRGRGRTPDAFAPLGMEADAILVALEETAEHYAELRPQLAAIDEATWTVPHPILGHLRLAQWLRFVAVHHRHHDKIIEGIRRRAAG